MRSIVALATVFASVASAQPLSVRDASSDTENGWSTVLQGDSSACADLAVIWARGTFDSGNIGPWVGAPFRDALVAKHSNVSFQGVDSKSYPANLDQYLNEGGSNSCGTALGAAVNSYASTCPDAKIVVSGWSQGSLCGRKSFSAINKAALANVIAFVAFADPYPLFKDSFTFPAVPSGVEHLNICKQDPTDPICGAKEADWPSTVPGVIDLLQGVVESIGTGKAKLNDAQQAAVGDLLVKLTLQTSGQILTLARDIADGHLQRWMLSPQHFWYGMDGSVEAAAKKVIAML